MKHSNQYQHLPDAEFVRMYHSTGNNEWLGRLLQRHTLLLLGVALKYLKERAAAEDALQQVFEKVLTKFPEEPVANVKGWLYVLLRNHCLSTLRDGHQLQPLENLHLQATESDINTQLEQELTLENLTLALADLEQTQQVCVREFYLEKRSYQEIMQRTGYTFSQVKSFIQNGKRNLKILLTKRNTKL